jgi:Flp pilus assembly protein TadB
MSRDEKWHRDIDRVVERTATAIAAALDRMVADLPEGAAPQMALEAVVRRLVPRKPWAMRLLMEDVDIREAYAAAVAEMPATARVVRDNGQRQ